MSTHNICFHRELRKILCGYPLICSYGWGLTTRQPLWVILCHVPEKERKEIGQIEEIVKELKERDREEKGIGMKVKKQKKYPYQLPLILLCPTVSQYQLDTQVTKIAFWVKKSALSEL